MRIAYITETYPPEINGVSLTVERSVRFLRSRGHHVELIRPRQPGEAACDDTHEWRTAGMPLVLYPGLRFGLASSWQLARRFARSRPDVVHIATEGPLGRAALSAARKRGVPVSTDFRTNFHFYSAYYGLGFLRPLIGAYLRDFHNRGELTIIPSRGVERELAADGFTHLEVVGRGVDSVRFSPVRRSRSLRAQWGASDDQPVLLHVGRLAREKNVELALRAFEFASSLHAPTCMVVVGDGPLRRKLERDFPAAHFVGALHGDELAAHYASADLFVFPSQSETFGNVALEAMASGLAVVGFEMAAVGDLVAHGENGFSVPRGDPGAFIATVCRAVAMDRSHLAPVRARARQTALRAGWDKILGRFETHLAQLADADSRDARRDVVLA